jgi:geranylgeranyl pyrophosphate synthase
MGSKPAASNLHDLLEPYLGRIEAALRRWLACPEVPATLAEAMRYAALDGGKRLRPAIVLMSAEAAASRSRWRADPLPAAVAVELVHCYSLVHDDLPAMDDDALRRGRATVHVKFGQAMAILVGDALLTRAFEVLCRGTERPSLAAMLAAELAAGAGPVGMIAGQVADMGLCHVPPGDPGRRYVHLRKTAALFRTAARMGGLCAGARPAALKALGTFGEKLGWAFQVADDLLDATASSAALGKAAGKDAQQGKRSYAGELGIEPTRRLIEQLSSQAASVLDGLGRRGDRLRELARLLARRQR